MRAVKSRDTKPEMIVRRLISSMGYRYRLHRSDLPGKPDMVFVGCRKLIFMHGCFWHGHQCARGNRVPKSNTEYWINKIRRNVARDKAVQKQLSAEGWDVLIVWECQLRNSTQLKARISRFLE